MLNISPDANDDMKAYLVDREEERAHERWRRRAKEHLPELARRVFALRGIGYNGCGFHYTVEALLGKVILALSQPNMKREDYQSRMASRCVDRVLVRGLFADLNKIEKNIPE
jgi:hypothetical protein